MIDARFRGLFRTGFVAVLLPIVVAGCATQNGAGMGPMGGLSREAKCAVLGAAVGAAAGALIADEVGGGLAGAAVGAVASTGFCPGRGDSDGDGVPDGKDQCPNTPAGAKVDKKGCPTDTDRDGVPDYMDQCVTPAGAKVDEKGCSLDSDGDGVADEDDMCPGTPAGSRVDDTGCPPDSDGDGVSDAMDQCPGTPEGWSVDTRGCPLPIVLPSVTFKVASAELTPEAKKVLDEKVVPTLLDNPAVRVLIVGHTSSEGSEAYNQRLSERRAESVKAYLVSRGVQAARLGTEGRGESEPVAPNSIEAGRAMNRRVEFFVVK